MQENEKAAIYAAIAQGASAKELESDFDVSYATGVRMIGTFKKAQIDGSITQLVNMDNVVLEQIKDSLLVPKELKEAEAESFGLMEKGLDGLSKLDVALQSTASSLNNKIYNLVLASTTPTELEVLTECLCKLRDSFFNKNGVNVNIQNNIGNNESAYKGFLSDVPKSQD